MEDGFLDINNIPLLDDAPFEEPHALAEIIAFSPNSELYDQEKYDPEQIWITASFLPINEFTKDDIDQDLYKNIFSWEADWKIRKLPIGSLALLDVGSIWEEKSRTHIGLENKELLEQKIWVDPASSAFVWKESNYLQHLFTQEEPLRGQQAYLRLNAYKTDPDDGETSSFPILISCHEIFRYFSCKSSVLAAAIIKSASTPVNEQLFDKKIEKHDDHWKFFPKKQSNDQHLGASSLALLFAMGDRAADFIHQCGVSILRTNDEPSTQQLVCDLPISEPFQIKGFFREIQNCCLEWKDSNNSWTRINQTPTLQLIEIADIEASFLTQTLIYDVETTDNETSLQIGDGSISLPEIIKFQKVETKGITSLPPQKTFLPYLEGIRSRTTREGFESIDIIENKSVKKKETKAPGFVANNEDCESSSYCEATDNSNNVAPIETHDANIHIQSMLTEKEEVARSVFGVDHSVSPVQALFPLDVISQESSYKGAKIGFPIPDFVRALWALNQKEGYSISTLGNKWFPISEQSVSCLEFNKAWQTSLPLKHRSKTRNLLSIVAKIETEKANNAYIYCVERAKKSDGRPLFGLREKENNDLYRRELLDILFFGLTEHNEKPKRSWPACLDLKNRAHCLNHRLHLEDSSVQTMKDAINDLLAELV